MEEWGSCEWRSGGVVSGGVEECGSGGFRELGIFAHDPRLAAGTATDP